MINQRIDPLLLLLSISGVFSPLWCIPTDRSIRVGGILKPVFQIGFFKLGWMSAELSRSSKKQKGCWGEDLQWVAADSISWVCSWLAALSSFRESCMRALKFKAVPFGCTSSLEQLATAQPCNPGKCLAGFCQTISWRFHTVVYVCLQ